MSPPPAPPPGERRAPIDFSAEPISPWLPPGAAAPPQPAPAEPRGPVWQRVLRRFYPHTLASRLVAFVLALVLVVVCSFGIVTYLALRTFLDQRLDQQLQNTATSFALLPPADTGAQPPNKIQAAGRPWARLVTADGGPVQIQTQVGNEEPVTSTLTVTGSPVPQLSEGQIKSLLGDLNDPRDMTTSDGVALRVVAIRTTLELDPLTFEHEYAILGLSTDELHGTLNHLLLLELLIGCGVLLLASGLTTLGVRTGLRPLYRITRTARAVSAELSPEGTGLDRRVPRSDPDSEIGQLADSVNTMLEAVETQFAARRANEDRMRQFMADASHELRTPLTSIRGYAELARLQRRAAGGTSDPGDHDVLDRIEAEGTRMSRMVEDLLMLARSDRGVQPLFGPLDVEELIDDVVSGARAAHPGRPIEADVEPFEMIADRDQLLRVLRNLITNAAVHTAPGGLITVTARTDGTWAWLIVSDAGPGLDPEQAQHVFERFWRADKARARARGGTGLGLAIVSAVVAAHGGAVRFDSSVEAGTTVTVTVPVVAEPPDAVLEDDRDESQHEDPEDRTE
jgi:two-component system OmpR family sensor kinase